MSKRDETAGKEIFTEQFETEHDSLPGGWFVEYNSDVGISALDYQKDSLELLSAGNKYLPVIPDLSDFELDMTFSVNYSMAKRFSFLAAFHYDLKTHRGKSIRIRVGDDAQATVEYGTTAANVFHTEQSRKFDISAEQFNAPVPFTMTVRKKSLALSFAGRRCRFKIPEGTGKIALSREHFFDTFSIHRLAIRTNDVLKVKRERKFRIPMPAQGTLYPIFCDVILRDYGTCMDAELTLSGGVPETPAGEGNYHSMRADILEKPFLKVITEHGVDKYVFYRDSPIYLVNRELLTAYFFGKLHREVSWPFRRTVRFPKPPQKFDLALGFSSYEHSTLPNLILSPAETVFTSSGRVLYSGLGLTEGANKVEFLSQAEKQIIAKLPKQDPRYRLAVEFARNNHYFFEGEKTEFSIRVTGTEFLPASYEVRLEDAYFTPLKTLPFQMECGETAAGISIFHTVTLKLSGLPALKPGVYHLRLKSSDPSVPRLEKYCAFEVMSGKKGAPPPPLISGLPFLYNSRTETRGLITDGFDPWTGAGVNEGHYIACANFLPPTARKYRIAPTVHAYGREWFCWLSSRCCDAPQIKDNLDLIREADYVNISDELRLWSVLWRHTYREKRLKAFLSLARTLNDPGFDIAAMERELRNGECVDSENFAVMARKYWEQWLDLCEKNAADEVHRALKTLRKNNPKLRLSLYGPAQAYASRYKGADFRRYITASGIAPDELGFWQYEDYPYSCRYGLEHGTYFLTACLMTMPGHRFCPEIYTGKGFQGCPDGAVFYAYPPFGFGNIARPAHMIRQVFNFALASAWFDGKKFNYWENCGFQTCKFTDSWYEALLEAWRIRKDFPPERPFRAPAYVTSGESLRAHSDRIVRSAYGPDSMENAAIIDVFNPSTGEVPMVYRNTRIAGLPAGFQVLMEKIGGLKAGDTDLLVLPPLRGVSEQYKKAIRKLHEKGVSLLAFEDADGLEDLFGIRDTGKRTVVRNLSGTKNFLPGMTEFCQEKRCYGTYAVTDAEVLIQAEIPVLTLKRNKTACAAFFNVPPQLVRQDELHERMLYEKASISDLMNQATVEIVRILTKPAVAVDGGRIIAYHAKNGHDVVIVYYDDDKEAHSVILKVAKAEGRTKFISCSVPCLILEETSEEFRIRLRLAISESAVLIFR